MEALARHARHDVRVYWVGGTTAVLLGWRQTTVDIDLVIQPEDEALLRAIPGLKESLADVQEMIARRLIDPAKARAYFARIEPQLYRFPAIHAPAFRAAVEATFPDSP